LFVASISKILQKHDFLKVSIFIHAYEFGKFCQENLQKIISDKYSRLDKFCKNSDKKNRLKDRRLNK
jgi:hypothetical protein